ncbi:MAG: formate acetyltransferase [Deltaproteobacteria bacterium]|nr:formate acetyltransferase [Candidatus Zymogenaceae bacterium]
MTEPARTFYSNRDENGEQKRSDRFARIKQALLTSPIHLCIERAHLVTDYFRHHDRPSEPMIVRKAGALAHILSEKSAKIFPDELIVGNVGAFRKSAIIQPELSGVFVNQEILWIGRRKTTPFQISWRDRFTLIFRIIPYWLFRNMVVRAFLPTRETREARGLTRRPKRLLRYVTEQLSPAYYLINVAAGIGHFIPNYEKIIKKGVTGCLAELEGRDDPFSRAARIACRGLVSFSRNLADEADRLAASEQDETRKRELLEIARITRRVPEHPAETFHEAVEALWLAHMTVCLEGINSAVSFGRIDQFLYPYYKRDIERGTITPDEARELILCFSAKCTEHVFHVSQAVSKYHGGFLVVQAAIVGGVDRAGNDAVNELTWLFLDVMEQSGLRDPNYQARMHKDSPLPYLHRAVEVARRGNGVPAFFSDDISIETLLAHGYPLEDARDYGVVGCVELAVPGKSFLSTDTALFNLPLCLELALNRGRRFGKRKRVGADTPDPRAFRSMDDVVGAFTAQVEFMVERMVDDLAIIDAGNRDYHPTPFSSLLVDGCSDSGQDVTEGGAIYNGSGVQGVGIADTADALAALDAVVFAEKTTALTDVVRALKRNFRGNDALRARLLSAPKFGNDTELPDRYADLAAHTYHTALTRYVNVRGGGYVAGFYSSTSHVAFGEKTGASPSGRSAGTSFAASLGAANGMDRLGPTALLNSVARVDARLAANGYATNLRFDPGVVSGDDGVSLLSSLIRGFFEEGGMEVQFNILDPEELIKARNNPGMYPGLVVRVAGYCAYFDDLPDIVKDEIINRTRLSFSGRGSVQ